MGGRCIYASPRTRLCGEPEAATHPPKQAKPIICEEARPTSSVKVRPRRQSPLFHRATHRGRISVSVWGDARVFTEESDVSQSRRPPVLAHGRMRLQLPAREIARRPEMRDVPPAARLYVARRQRRSGAPGHLPLSTTGFDRRRGGNAPPAMALFRGRRASPG